jgi:hypothetical protein
MSAFEKQVGGGHYKDLAIQPLEYITKNNLDYIQGNIIKYATRYPLKNGIEDLDKIIHYCELAKESMRSEPVVEPPDVPVSKGFCEMCGDNGTLWDGICGPCKIKQDQVCEGCEE